MAEEYSAGERLDLERVLAMERDLNDIARSKMQEKTTDRNVDNDDELDASLFRSRSVGIKSDFITASDDGTRDGVTDIRNVRDWQSCVEFMRHVAKRFVLSTVADCLLGIVVLADVCLSIYALDLNAASEEPPAWLALASGAIFVVYALELCAVLLTRKKDALRDGWVQLDVIIVVAGAVDVLLNLVGQSDADVLGAIRMFRILRVLRLVSMLRKVVFLRELRKLAMMLLSCLKTLLWSFLFCFLCMAFWSMLAVDMVHPHMQKLEEQGAFEFCSTCRDGFSSVLRGQLTLFKTIVAGDGWGQIAEPVIIAHPHTAWIFMGSVMTIVFGVLNLIVAAVVDEFAEQRVRDVNAIAEKMDEQHKEDMNFLAGMFKKIDEDSSGELSLEELINGARKVPEFRSRLRVMDIDQDDLQQLFIMLDEDSSGSIAPGEFMGALSRWRNESKTASRFVKYNALKVLHRQDEMIAIMSALKQRIDKLDRQLRKGIDTETGSQSPKASDTLGNWRSEKSDSSWKSQMSASKSESVRRDDVPSRTVASAASPVMEARTAEASTEFLQVQEAARTPKDDIRATQTHLKKLFETMQNSLKGAHEALRSSKEAAELMLQESQTSEFHQEAALGLQRALNEVSLQQPSLRSERKDEKVNRHASSSDKLSEERPSSMIQSSNNMPLLGTAPLVLKLEKGAELDPG